MNEQLIQWFLENPKRLKHSSSEIANKRRKCLGLTPDEVQVCKDFVRAGGIPRGSQVLKSSLPKILFFDLETAPMVSYHWRRFKENIGLDQTISESFIICYTVKWLGDVEYKSFTCTPEEMLMRDDSRIVNILWSYLDQADIVVAHNAKRADIAWTNSRFLIHGLGPTSSYHVVDTLEVCKKRFGFSSNKLDAIAGYLGIEHKLDTDFNLWRGCMEGDLDSLNYMTEYNVKDVLILEEVYLALLPWMGNIHPNVSRWLDYDGCVACGSSEYEELVGQYYITPFNKYQLYRCKSCGAVFHSRKPIEGVRRNVFATCAR